MSLHIFIFSVLLIYSFSINPFLWGFWSTKFFVKISWEFSWLCTSPCVQLPLCHESQKLASLFSSPIFEFFVPSWCTGEAPSYSSHQYLHHITFINNHVLGFLRWGTKLFFSQYVHHIMWINNHVLGFCLTFLIQQQAVVNSDVLSDGKYRIWSGKLTWREVRKN